MNTFFSDKERWSIDDVAKLLVSNNALTAVTHDDAIEIVRRMTPYRVKDGTVLFREGNQDAKFMIFILQGEAVVERSADGHSEASVMKLLGEGDLIGEMGIVDSAARSATVRAVSEMALAVMDQAAFKRMVQEMPAVACSLLGVMLQSVSGHLRQSNRKLHTMTQINKSLHDELDGGHARELELARRLEAAGLFAETSAGDSLLAETGPPAKAKRSSNSASGATTRDPRWRALPPDVNVELLAGVDLEVQPSVSGGRRRFASTYSLGS